MCRRPHEFKRSFRWGPAPSGAVRGSRRLGVADFVGHQRALVGDTGQNLGLQTREIIAQTQTPLGAGHQAVISPPKFCPPITKVTGGDDRRVMYPIFKYPARLFQVIAESSMVVAWARENKIW